MTRDSELRDPRVEPIDPVKPSSNAYLHRAAQLAVLLAIPALAGAGSLPRLRGPAGPRMGVERARLSAASPSRGLAWRTEVPQGVSAPVVADGRVFVTGLEDGELAVTCLDAMTGKRLWRSEPASYSGVAIAAPVLASQEGGAGTNLTAEQCETLTKLDVGEDQPASTVIANGRLYVRTAKAVYCFGSLG